MQRSVDDLRRIWMSSNNRQHVIMLFFWCLVTCSFLSFCLITTTRCEVPSSLFFFSFSSVHLTVYVLQSELCVLRSLNEIMSHCKVCPSFTVDSGTAVCIGSHLKHTWLQPCMDTWGGQSPLSFLSLYFTVFLDVCNTGQNLDSDWEASPLKAGTYTGKRGYTTGCGELDTVAWEKNCIPLDNLLYQVVDWQEGHGKKDCDGRDENGNK